jgi:hypothetical protein
MYKGHETLNRLPRELARLTSLQSLDLSWGYQVSGDLSLLAGLTTLQELNLSRCEKLNDDLAPLASLTKLGSLDLSYCGFRRFTPVESLLPTLKELYLYGCKFDDLPAEVCGKEYGENVLYKVRSHYRQRRPDASPKIAPTQPLGTPPQIFISYAWGNISPNATQEDHQCQEVVERLCIKLEQERWNLIRDKGALDNGDQISGFMKTLGQARLVIVVLSEKTCARPIA